MSLLSVVGMVVLGLGLPIVLFLQFRWHWFPLQYLYFLRIPIAFGVLLVCSPFAAGDIDLAGPNHWRPGSFGNLFVLEPFGLLLTSVLAVLTAWTIVHAGRWLYAHSPKRLQLTLRGYDSDKAPAKKNAVTSDHASRRHLLYASLAFPPIVCAAMLSTGPGPARAGAAIGGVLLAFGLRWAINRTFPYDDRGPDVKAPRSAVVCRLRGFACRVTRSTWYRGLESCVARHLEAPSVAQREPAEYDEPSVWQTRQNLTRFLGVTLTVYVVFCLVLLPEWRLSAFQWIQDQVPALAYVLLLVMLLCWVLSWFSLMLDKFRVPAELAAVALVFLVFLLFRDADTDHTYTVSNVHCDEQAATLTPAEYVSRWMARRPGTDLVVVAASGGGISAAYWTATVLAQLQLQFPEHFARSLALISTTSGGGVGAMYYVAGFTDDGKGGSGRPPQDLSAILDSAGRSSLGAMGWGLIYPDFVRLLLPPAALGADRGWALERRWAQRLPDPPPTLRSWEADVRAGWRPAMVFNATFTETGGRLLISPLDVPSTSPDVAGAGSSPEPWRAQNFVRMYPGGDIAVVTAARLSSTFPYVTPVARPSAAASCPKSAYHVADGGYYDNFGVMTLVDFLRGGLTHVKEARRSVLIVEIHASDSTRRADPRLGQAFRLELIGPADTLMAVRSTSQLERNQLELAMLRAIWPDSVAPKSAVFELRADSPLSWHLSSEERDTIRAYSDARCPHNQQALETVAAFFRVQAPAARPNADQACARLERRQVPTSLVGAS